MAMTIAQQLAEIGTRCAEQTALCFDRQRWSYRELQAAARDLAAALTRAGIEPRERVAFFLPNCPELVICYLACLHGGAIAVPLNYRYRYPEVHHALEHCGAGTLIFHAEKSAEIRKLPLAGLGLRRCYRVGADRGSEDFPALQSLLEQGLGDLRAPAIDPAQAAAILYTSGTTSRPKGVIYSQETLLRSTIVQIETQVLTPVDRHLVSMSISHAAGLIAQLLSSFCAGGSCILMDRPAAAEIVDTVRTHRATRLQMLPANLEDLVEHLEQTPAPLPSLKCAVAGGDSVPVALHRRFLRQTGIEVTEVCGMTECLSYLANPPFGEKRLGSVGKPAYQTTVRLVDAQGKDVPPEQTGEMLVQGPGMMVGYWNDPAATREALRDGWLHTGDLARRDADGYYWFVGRRKEIIIRGGSNISPGEVEGVLGQHPAVHLCGVVGKPDARFGQVPIAFVALVPNAAAPGEQELKAFAAERIAAYKVPERILFVPQLPLNASGKVDRQKLHALSAATV